MSAFSSNYSAQCRWSGIGTCSFFAIHFQFRTMWRVYIKSTNLHWFEVELESWKKPKLSWLKTLKPITLIFVENCLNIWCQHSLFSREKKKRKHILGSKINSHICCLNEAALQCTLVGSFSNLWNLCDKAPFNYYVRVERYLGLMAKYLHIFPYKDR